MNQSRNVLRDPITKKNLPQDSDEILELYDSLVGVKKRADYLHNEQELALAETRLAEILLLAPDTEVRWEKYMAEFQRENDRLRSQYKGER
jgi:hypothetical protein